MPHRIGSVHGRYVDISDSTFRPLRSVPSIKALALYGLVDGREDFAIDYAVFRVRFTIDFSQTPL